jgi:predicted  nucleic acid-binding Zn-ribbon protein
LFFIATGCSTLGGGGQMENTIYDMHRRVANIEKNMQGAGKAGEVNAELMARLDATDQQAKALQTTVEENTARLQSIEKKLDELRSRLYRASGLSSGTTVGGTSEAIRHNETGLWCSRPEKKRLRTTS